MKSPKPEIIEMSPAEFDELMLRAEQGTFDQADYVKILDVLKAYFYMLQLIDKKSISIARLRQILFGASTEKTSNVLGDKESTSAANGKQGADGNQQHGGGHQTDVHQAADGESASAAASAPTGEEKPKKPGHGRNGAAAYAGATRVRIRHSSLRPGAPCPECAKGKAYAMAEPGTLIRLIGQASLAGRIYELEKLRCNLCGQIFTAQPPADAAAEKYDFTAVSMIAMLKYGMGFPFNRLDQLQENLEIPLPASTQWEIVSAAVPAFEPVLEEMIRQAAQGEVLHHDDTNVRILELMGERARKAAFEESNVEESKVEQSNAEDGADVDSDSRTGLFTSGVVAISGEIPIALFFSGRKHAGENLLDLLRRRATDLPPPIQMCDALSRNMPGELKTIIANCLAHGRRRFVEVHERFPAECRYVLEAFKTIYANDASTHKDNLSVQERLVFHQTHSGPVMVELRTWLKRQFDERRVEPNSGLGAAINYLLKHWDKLTLFLRVAGAPLDNNICERALKKAILHRKNSLFYKTQNGAKVGDLYMSLIYTCQLNGVNPFDYLTELQRHADEVAAAPAAWLPWNYDLQLGRDPTPAVAA